MSEGHEFPAAAHRNFCIGVSNIFNAARNFNSFLASDWPTDSTERTKQLLVSANSALKSMIGPLYTAYTGQSGDTAYVDNDIDTPMKMVDPVTPDLLMADDGLGNSSDPADTEPARQKLIFKAKALGQLCMHIKADYLAMSSGARDGSLNTWAEELQERALEIDRLVESLSLDCDDDTFRARTKVCKYVQEQVANVTEVHKYDDPPEKGMDQDALDEDPESRQYIDMCRSNINEITLTYYIDAIIPVPGDFGITYIENSEPGFEIDLSNLVNVEESGSSPVHMVDNCVRDEWHRSPRSGNDEDEALKEIWHNNTYGALSFGSVPDKNGIPSLRLKLGAQLRTDSPTGQDPLTRRGMAYFPVSGQATAGGYDVKISGHLGMEWWLTERDCKDALTTKGESQYGEGSSAMDIS